MTKQIFIAIFAALILAQLPAFAKPKRKEYDNSAAQVFDAALKTAKNRYVVTTVDEGSLKFTFETGRSPLSNGYVATVSIEAESEGRSALLIDMQHKNPGDGFAFNEVGHLTDQFYEQVRQALGPKPIQPAAVKPEATPVTVPPPPVASTSAHDYGTVAVSCSIESADVTVDGAFVGNLPTSLRLSAGKHTVRVTFAGYKPWSREITVMAGGDLRLIATLTKE